MRRERRKEGRDGEEEQEEESIGGRTNVAAANGFIGMIPVINFFLSLLRRQNEKRKVELKCEPPPRSVTRCLDK